MKKAIVLSLLFLCSYGFSQINYREEFVSALQMYDTIRQQNILKKWNIDNPNDADLYASYLNYHFLKSVKENNVMSPKQIRTDSKPLKDSLGNIVGYMTNVPLVNEEELQKGIDKINRGIGLHPSRLDLRFSKAYVYAETENWDKLTQTILEMLQFSQRINNEWIWNNNEALGKASQTMFDQIQKYQNMLYNTNIDEQLYNMRLIAEEILRYNPTHFDSLNNMALTHLVLSENEKGLDYLLQAEKVNPRDGMLLYNIANAYKLMENKPKAIEYYQKVLIDGNQDAKKDAQKNLSELRKK